MRAAWIFAAVLGLDACQPDETVSGHGGAETEWRLVTLDGAAFGARATLGFPEEGVVAGEGPCNTYRGTQSAPYPWFDAGRISTTRRACPELEAEARFLDALAEMTLVEVAGDTLILSTDSGREMVFRAPDT